MGPKRNDNTRAASGAATGARVVWVSRVERTGEGEKRRRRRQAPQWGRHIVEMSGVQSDRQKIGHRKGRQQVQRLNRPGMTRKIARNDLGTPFPAIGTGFGPRFLPGMTRGAPAGHCDCGSDCAPIACDRLDRSCQPARTDAVCEGHDYDEDEDQHTPHIDQDRRAWFGWSIGGPFRGCHAAGASDPWIRGTGPRLSSPHLQRLPGCTCFGPSSAEGHCLSSGLSHCCYSP